MKSADEEVLRAAAGWLEEGHSAYLVTVVKTWGSSPRPLGSLLAVRDDGEFVGSVSGGCVEDDLVRRLIKPGELVSFPCIESYGVTPEQTRRFGLPCGGRLDLAIEALAGTEPLRAILGRLESRELVARRLCLATGEASLHPARIEDSFRFDGENVVKVFGPAWRLILIGAGQLSRYVAEMALALDYDLTVCDPRAEYAAGWEVERARLDTRMPDDVVRRLGRDERSAVLALAHDPRLDDMALLEALTSKAFYVGSLGSRANNAKRRARLASLGVPEAALARLHGPVGLPIGSRTPPEIAIAILAELTAVRNGIALRAVEDAAAESGGAREAVPACGGLRASC